MKKNKAFTLIELLVVIAIIALLIGILLPAIGKARDTAKNVLSQSRMRQLALGANSYAADNGDLLFAYSFKGPRGTSGAAPRMSIDCDAPATGGAGASIRVTDDTAAAQVQQTRILRRVTGRCEGTDAIVNETLLLPFRRWNHVVLLDYLTTTQPEPIAASPFDKNQLDWQANPTDYTIVPYAGTPQAGSDTNGQWRNNQGLNQRWAFASSYQTVPAVWNTDGNKTKTYTPVSDTPHLFQPYDPNPPGNGNNIQIPLGGRKFAQVAFPAGKVMQFEEFDRLSNRQGLAWMYPQAQCNLSFFDGSVRRLSSSDANPGWNPRSPDQEWRQTYVPLDLFPRVVGEATTRYCQRYRWTRFGLSGIDFGGQEIGRPFSLGDASSAVCVQ